MSFDDIARAAAEDAGGLDAKLLGDFLPSVAAAVSAGRRIGRPELRRCREFGRRAASAGIALRAVIDLYLSATWRLWPTLPEVERAALDPAGVVAAGSIILRASDDAVAELAEGYQLARRQLVRSEVAARRDFVHALLTGSGSAAAELVNTARRFGLDLAGPHAVAVVRAELPLTDAASDLLERAALGADRDALAAVQDGRIVVVFAARDRPTVDEVVSRLTRVLPSATAHVRIEKLAAIGDWRMAVGRSHVGPAGVRLSFDEARESLDLADRLGAGAAVVDSADLLAHRVLLRDEAALRDLIDSLLGPLRDARGGSAPLLDTLHAYFEAGGNSSETARRLHLSVRAVTYRLDRIRALTGSNPDDPAHRFALQAAVLGARLLSWK